MWGWPHSQPLTPILRLFKAKGFPAALLCTGYLFCRYSAPFSSSQGCLWWQRGLRISAEICFTDWFWWLTGQIEISWSYFLTHPPKIMIPWSVLTGHFFYRHQPPLLVYLYWMSISFCCGTSCIYNEETQSGNLLLALRVSFGGGEGEDLCYTARPGGSPWSCCREKMMSLN